MAQQPFSTDARALEEAFFAKENAQLLQRLKEKAAREEQREALRSAIKGADDELVDHLLGLGIGAETALAVLLAPLAVVAWADGAIDARERQAILEAADERGLRTGTPGREMLESWLERKPGPDLVAAWKRYMRAMCSDLSVHERSELGENVLGLARGVAEAAGGFLGLTSRISPAERAVLDDLERALA